MNLEQDRIQLQQLELKCTPIAIAFRSEAPRGVARVSKAAASGCSYWKLAAEGYVFYTEPSDHYGCAIGSYTHGVDLPPAQGKELEGMIETMVGLHYLKMEEVPAIPRREQPFGVVIYAPLAQVPVEPDVVIVRGNAKQMMLLAEATNAAGVSSASGIMGRPTCAMIPAVMKSQGAAISLGCIGNRVYNELDDDEMYAALNGLAISRITDRLEAITSANLQLKRFHAGRIRTVENYEHS